MSDYVTPAAAEFKSSGSQFNAFNDSWGLDFPFSDDEEPAGDKVECRICHEEDFIGKLEAPCACSGSLKEYWVQSWEEDEFTNEDGEHLEEETLMQDAYGFPTSEAKEIEETKAEQEFKAFKASENDKLTNGEEPVEKIEESENTDGDNNAQYEEMEDESIDKDVRVHGGQNVNNSGMTFDVSLREENLVGSFPLYSLSKFEEESNDYFLMAKNDVIVPQEYAAKVDVLKTYFIENHPRELFFMTRKDNDFVESQTSYYPQLGVENLLSDTGWVNMEMFFDLEELLEMSRENGQDPICTQRSTKSQRCNKKMPQMQYTSKQMAKKIVALDGIRDPYESGYTAPMRGPPAEETVIDIRQWRSASSSILVIREDIEDPDASDDDERPPSYLEAATAEHLLEVDHYDECATASGIRTALIRSTVLLFLAVQMMRHAFSLIDEDDHQISNVISEEAREAAAARGVSLVVPSGQGRAPVDVPSDSEESPHEL
ncbi:hypothetical protein RJ640_025684 [Escallonia rubra]|uniref:Uncharacterized protein n=1 Tax=Escallonia rubra TaxID=112253 RepID=A0AA88SMP1_9ASTE|nr:hypothetical protein RJ640_025684 [Escallonia rubra]